MNINKTISAVKRINTRSAWKRGVKKYALMLLEDLKENYSGRDLVNPRLLSRALLNGAADWQQFSWGGCALIYDGQIAVMVCTSSELKRKKGGELPPNSREQWLDVQARALFQAEHLIVENTIF
jgi:hypothetical protein